MIITATTAAVAVAGCGGEGDSAAGSAAPVQAAAPAKALMEDAARDLSKVRSYHVDAEFEEAGEVTAVSGDLLPNGVGHVTMTVGERRAEMILLEDGVYLKGNADFWSDTAGAEVPNAVIRRLSGRWVVQGAPDDATTGILDEMAPRRIAACLRGGTGTVTRKGTTTIDGVAVTVVEDAGDAPGTSPSRYYVRRDAPHLLVRAIQTGPDHPGEIEDRACAGDREDSDSSSDTADVRFTRFDDVAPVRAPRGAKTVQAILRGASRSGDAA